MYRVMHGSTTYRQPDGRFVDQGLLFGSTSGLGKTICDEWHKLHIQSELIRYTTNYRQHLKQHQNLLLLVRSLRILIAIITWDHHIYSIHLSKMLVSLLPPPDGGFYESLDQALESLKLYAAQEGYAIMKSNSKISGNGTVVRKLWCCFMCC